jgi:hypothetical protein
MAQHVFFPEGTARCNPALRTPRTGLRQCPWLNRREPIRPGSRAQVQFIVHETGKLTGEFVLSVDLDSTTTRALGQFLIDLADRSESRNN